MRAWVQYAWPVMLGCGMAMAQTPAQRLSEAEAIKSLQAEAERAATADEFSGALLVAKGDKIIFQQAYGLADREQKIPNTLNTKFRFGSLGKMFTGVAILQLVQAGKLKLDDPVGKYLPDYPNQEVAKVTIHQLLTHTGGTGDFFGPEYLQRRNEMREHSDYLQLLGQRGTSFTPGTRHGYSNYGYLLLGRIIEVVSGQSYYDYVAEHVFKPAGMTATGNTPENQPEPNRAVGYSRRNQPMLIQLAPPEGDAGALRQLPPLPPRGPAAGDASAEPPGAWRSIANDLDYRGTAAGGGFSTVGDLLKFATALQGNRLLNAEFTQLAITGKVATGQAGRSYAYGFEDVTTEGSHYIGHGGGSSGMNGWLGIYPQSGGMAAAMADYIVIGLSNFDPPAAESLTRFISSRLPL